MNREKLEQIITQVLAGRLAGNAADSVKQEAEGVFMVKANAVSVGETDRMDTGKAGDVVYTHDLFSLDESPRLGCGIMEMDHTKFDWTLNYDEIDYVIDGSLTILAGGKSVTAGPGELILIPKGSRIQFCVKEHARFLYVTYPADWASQA